MTEVPLPDATATVVTGLLGAGGIGMWFKERRKGKRDANDFALAFINDQSKRIGDLTSRLDDVVGRLATVEADLKTSQASERRLETENRDLRTGRTADAAEIVRLQTALMVEHDRATALAAAERGTKPS